MIDGINKKGSLKILRFIEDRLIDNKKAHIRKHEYDNFLN